MASSAWAKALAGVFVEARPAGAPEPVPSRHLEVVSSPESLRAPALVVVTLDLRATRADLAAVIHACEVVAFELAQVAGDSAVVVLGGIDAPRRRGWKSKVRHIVASASQLVGAVRTARPQVLLVDAESFRALPAEIMSGSVVAGIGRDGDDAAYTGLFALETQLRVPESKVWAGSSDELTANRVRERSLFAQRRRGPGMALGDGFIGLLSE